MLQRGSSVEPLVSAGVLFVVSALLEEMVRFKGSLLEGGPRKPVCPVLPLPLKPDPKTLN